MRERPFNQGGGRRREKIAGVGMRGKRKKRAKPGGCFVACDDRILERGEWNGSRNTFDHNNHNQEARSNDQQYSMLL